MKHRGFAWYASLLAALAVPFSVQAQSYPARPIRMVVPFAPGGGTDIVARAVAQKVGESLRQAIVVDNRTGANANIGTESVAKSPPDGYTILMTSSALAINPSLYKGLGYDVVRDFAPITLATLIPFILVVTPTLPVASVKQLVALARARPGQLVYSSAGTGNATHLSMALFEMLAKVQMTHVPYKGTGQAITDVMGGHVQLMFGAIPSTMPGVRAGKLRILAISSAKRSSVLSDVPTVAESGLPGYELTSWYGALAPAGTPEPIVTQLNTEIVKALNLPEVRTRLSAEGADPVGNTPQQFQAYIQAEMAKYARIVAALGLNAGK